MRNTVMSVALAAVFASGACFAQTSTADFADVQQAAKSEPKADQNSQDRINDAQKSLVEQIEQAASEDGVVKTDAELAGDDESFLDQLQRAAQQIELDAIVDIPIQSLKAVRSKGGQVEYISEGGRYALRGELIDLWHHKVLDTPEQITESVEHLYFDNLGKPITALNTLSLATAGADAPQVVAFVDASDPSSRELVTQAKALIDQYNFHFVVIPVTSIDGMLYAACAADRQGAVHSFESGTLDQMDIDEDCDVERIGETLIAMQFMGIDGVPFIVAPDGFISRGLQPDLGAWIKEHEK